MFRMFLMPDKEVVGLDFASKLNISPAVAKQLQSEFLDAGPGQGKPR